MRPYTISSRRYNIYDVKEYKCHIASGVIILIFGLENEWFQGGGFAFFYITGGRSLFNESRKF